MNSLLAFDIENREFTNFSVVGEGDCYYLVENNNDKFSYGYTKVYKRDLYNEQFIFGRTNKELELNAKKYIYKYYSRKIAKLKQEVVVSKRAIMSRTETIKALEIEKKEIEEIINGTS